MMLVLFWSNFPIFVSQMCFVFFFNLWFCQSSLGFRLLYNFLEHFHSAQVSHHGCRGCPFAGPDFLKRPFLRATLGEALSQGHLWPEVQVKGASQLVLLVAGLPFLFLLLPFASCQPPSSSSCQFLELAPSQLLGPVLLLGLSHWLPWLPLQVCKSKVVEKNCRPFAPKK